MSFHPIAKTKAAYLRLKNDSSFTIKDSLVLSSGVMGDSMMRDMLNTFIVMFLTDFMAIPTTIMIIIMIIARVADSFGDPLVGLAIDRTHTKYGKARPYLALSPVPLAVASVLLFVVPQAALGARVAYVLVIYIAWGILFSFYDVPLWSLSASMATSTNDRKNLYTIANIADTVGSILPGAVVPLFLSMYKNDFHAKQNVFMIAAIVFSAVACGMMLLAFFKLKEKVPVVIDKKPPVKMNFKALFKNLPLISVFLSAIFASFRSMGYGAAIYFFQHTLNRIELSTILGFFSGPISYAVMALMPILGKKFSSRNIMIGGYLYTAFIYFMMFIIGYDNIILLCIIIAISGAPVGIIRIAGSITVAESIQYMEWKTGIRSESMVFSINTLKNKITATLSSVWLPIGLSIIGYQTAKTVGEQVVQSEATKQGLFLIYALAPLFGSLFAGLILFIDPFYGKKKEKIMAELKERQNEKMNFTEIESAN